MRLFDIKNKQNSANQGKDIKKILTKLATIITDAYVMLLFLNSSTYLVIFCLYVVKLKKIQILDVKVQEIWRELKCCLW